MDLHEYIRLVEGMDNNDKFDATKVRGALFALITARLEDAHEIAVKGQSSKTDQNLISQLTSDLEAHLEEIQTLLNASAIVTQLT